MSRETQLALLKSDLKDSFDPKILSKYPHLGTDELRREIREKISKLEIKDAS